MGLELNIQELCAAVKQHTGKVIIAAPRRLHLGYCQKRVTQDNKVISEASFAEYKAQLEAMNEITGEEREVKPYNQFFYKVEVLD